MPQILNPKRSFGALGHWNLGFFLDFLPEAKPLRILAGGIRIWRLAAVCISLFFSAVTVFSFSTPPSFALEIPARPEGYVSDDAAMISPTERARLEARLHQFENETSNQIVVVTFPTLEGEVLEDFSIRLAEAWKIGQKDKDNGVILLLFKNDRKVRIEVGYGLESVLPDATCKLIIEEKIVPRFREGKFDEGVERAVEAIMAATKGEYHGEPFLPAKDNFGLALLTGIFLGSLLPLLLLWVLFFFGILFAGGSLIGGSLSGLFYALILGVMPLTFYYLFGRHTGGHTVLSRRGYYSGGGIFGGGGFSSGGFGGGGFSGGGGSFGGGGAGGRW